MSSESEDIIIIGAGPTGLSAALFLTEYGYKPKIIERRKDISPYSKAFGVNARTLELLSPSGVSNSFIENGRKLETLNMYRRGKRLAQVHLDKVNHKYNFMCVQSQRDSEKILQDAVIDRGISVERGLEVIAIRTQNNLAIVDVKSDSSEYRFTAKTVFAADGAGSFTRKSLNIGFKGDEYDEPWKLYDIELKMPLDKDDGHVFLLDGGGMFVVRHTNNVWRLLGTGEDLLSVLPKGTNLGKIHWESDFEIVNAVADQFSIGPYYLGGDAAHVHAGIGARGMNLGIEDAYVFAELYHRKELNRYHSLRYPVVKKLVGQIKKVMNVPRGNTAIGKTLRRFPFLVIAGIPLVRRFAQPWILGLDHDIDI